MSGKQAKILTKEQVAKVLHFLRSWGSPSMVRRNMVMFLLSIHAGLRAAEISKITWGMVMNSQGLVGEFLELEDYVAKKKHGRTIPMTAQLIEALEELRLEQFPSPNHPIVRSQRGWKLTPKSVSKWFGEVYGACGFVGCTSHSGRRTFITTAAELVKDTGGSIRDVQELAGHTNLNTTQRYIEGSAEAKVKIVEKLSSLSVSGRENFSQKGRGG